MYAFNKANSRTYNQGPTKTDQSGAKETDINIIVKRFAVSNQMPNNGKTPMYGDFTKLPTELRDVYETARAFNEHRDKLPKQLRDLPTHELLNLTPHEIATLLKPTETPAKTETKTEEPAK